MNEYEKQGLKAKYPGLYEQLNALDAIAAAVGKIWEEKYEEALTELETIEVLPIKKQEFISGEKTRAFLNLPPSLQN